jgi:hypothetical protein
MRDSRTKKYNTHSICKPCYQENSSIRRIEYYYKNKKKQIEQASEWNKKNKKRYDKNRLKYREKHKDKIKQDNAYWRDIYKSRKSTSIKKRVQTNRHSQEHKKALWEYEPEKLKKKMYV